ncbi:MAG: NAD(P)/FAD-dependent oxidoreductase [Thermoplasmatales archaeon]|nr:NAD(P)/FAD-dependent oxidoreductase [Thermoplasmatales archaeon]
MKKFQVAIIGGGVIGSSIARELSRYDVSVVVFESGSDVASQASKANSGVIHSGINSPPYSLKARLCVEGNRMFQSLAGELGVPVKWVGKFVVAGNEDEIAELEHLKRVGESNGVPGLEILDEAGVKKKEKNISCRGALWVPTAGITSPYQLTIALAENAAENNVKFLLETKVIGLKKQAQKFFVNTTKGGFLADVVVNAAGVFCRDIVAMLEEPDFNVYPCRGEYLVLDKSYSWLVRSMVYPVPPKHTGVLGIHITPTIEGNILLGPSAEFINEDEDTRTTREAMISLLKHAKEMVPVVPDNAVINAYSGIRSKLASAENGGWADFRIEESRNTPGLINILGIESPGLTAAPAIAKEAIGIIAGLIVLKEKGSFKSNRARVNRFSGLLETERAKMIEKDSKWGRVVCRCEQVTEREVTDALSNPLGARTLSSVKYRCRAGMGRCQGGFCTPHIVRIMKDNFGMDVIDIKLKSPNSTLFTGRVREVREHG